ncbi:MAG: methionyl-tRNA formyltransferase [Ardenticatenales bacterium]
MPPTFRPRVVFMGTPAFAVPTLDALLGAAADADGAPTNGAAAAVLTATRIDVVAVFTQPDRPAGRGRRVAPSPVKARALDAGVPVFQPPSLRRGAGAEAALAALADLAPDLVVVAAYGLLLPPAVLDRPRYGALNVHASLLPRWRGAAPIQRAILAGDPETGVTIMRMDAGLDTGPMVAKGTTPIGPDDTAVELTERLAVLGAHLLVATLPAWFDGTALAVSQDDAHATLAPRLTRDDGRLDAAEGAAALERRVRAMQPWPGAWLPLADGSVLKVMRAEVIAGSVGVPSASTSPLASELTVDHGWPVLWTTDGGLLLRVVQPPGKGPMDGDAFVRGRPEALARPAAPR